MRILFNTAIKQWHLLLLLVMVSMGFTATMQHVHFVLYTNSWTIPFMDIIKLVIVVYVPYIVGYAQCTKDRNQIS